MMTMAPNCATDGRLWWRALDACVLSSGHFSTREAAATMLFAGEAAELGGTAGGEWPEDEEVWV